MTKTYVIVSALILALIIVAFTVLSAFHVDTDRFVSFIQLIFAATTSIIGIFLVKRTGEASSAATAAQEQVAAVSDQVHEVKTMVNGNTAALIARVGPVLPENDETITSLADNITIHETGAPNGIS